MPLQDAKSGYVVDAETGTKLELKFNGSGVGYSLWKRRFEGYAITSGCMQAFTTVTDIMVDDPSVTSRFLLDQGFAEISVKRS